MLEAKYGLPLEVRFCKRCVISNCRPSSVIEHLSAPDDPKPTIAFTDGVCSACIEAEKKAATDWVKRENELYRLLDKHRSRLGEIDCIVPGSGGKDSVYAAHVLKHKYGMHPLTCTWAPHIYTEVGWRNHRRFCAIADNYLLTPNEHVHRLLTRLALENLFHPFQPFILGQKAFPPRLAAQLGIGLVIYGESGREYGNSADGGPEVARGYFSPQGELRLAGVLASELEARHGLVMQDLAAYLPLATPPEGLEVRYLGHYLKWKPQECYYYACEYGGFEAASERTPGTYSKYNSIDDKLDDLHYWTTWIKFGIGRATYDAAQEIRSGDITREEGVALVKRFDGEYPERFEREVFEYLSVPGFPDMTRERLFMLANKFRSPHLWHQEFPEGIPEMGIDWKLSHHVWD